MNQPNTTSPAPATATTAEQPAAANPESAPATTAEATAEPTAAPEIVENRDLAAAVTIQPAEPFRHTTRQFDLGDNRRLVDMRPTNGGLDIIPAAGADFADVPAMSRDDAILAALDIDGMSDKDKLALVRQIVTATR